MRWDEGVRVAVGGGGREHALVWKLAQSSHVGTMWAAPGNPGIAAEALSSSGRPVELLDIAATDLRGLADAAERLAVDLTVVGWRRFTGCHPERGRC